MSSADAITDIEARLEALEQEEQELRESLAKAQLERWEGHLDELQVQVRLGAMEVRDRLEPILTNLKDQLAAARARSTAGSESAADAAAALRSGVDEAWKEMRKALSQAKEILAG